MMRHILLLIFVLFFAFLANTQENQSFQIIKSDISTPVELYKKAISEANMEPYRNRTVNDTLVFENGLTFVLFSAKKLQSLGILTNIEKYEDPKERYKFYQKPVFKLSDEGILMAKYPKQDIK